MKHIRSIKKIIDKLTFILTKKHKLFLVALLFVSVLDALFNTLCIYIISPFVAAMTSSDAFFNNRAVMIIVSLSGYNDFKKVFFLLCILIALMYLIKEIITVFRMWFSQKYSFLVSRELSEIVLSSYMERNYDFFIDYGTANVMRDVKDDTNNINVMLNNFVNLTTELLTVAMIVLYIIVSDWQMSIVICALSMICIGLMYGVFRKKVVEAGYEVRNRAANNQKVLLESVEGIKEIQVMKKENYFIKLFRDTLLKTQKSQMVLSIATFSPTCVIEGLFVIGFMLYFGTKSRIDGTFFSTLPMMASFMAGAIRMLPSIGRISNSLNSITFCIPSLKSVFDNVKLIREQGISVQNEFTERSDEMYFSDCMMLKNIIWKYPDGNRNIIDNVDLCINKGESVGIIGQSGAGKSTLADIILRLHIPQSGCILIDGKNVSDHTYGYSKIIGYVPQSIYLVDGSVRENVAFGEESDEIDDGAVWASLSQAKLADYVKELDDGLDTIVGERGVKFSGGQRQRLAIARALYRRPQILILDEATSALDNETEASIISEIESLHGKITMIIIAHRLTSVKNCDTIYEIVDGKMIARNKNSIGL